MDILNFFREDLSEILGVYYDEEKIYLARLTDKFDTEEIHFEIDSTSNAPAAFQLAEKIKFFCKKNGWKTSKIGLALRDGSAVTFQTEFKNIPENEVASAVKIWAIAHVKQAPRYTSMQIGEELWMEALPASIVEEYLSAFEKNSMTLCALTETPPDVDDDPIERAAFAAEIIKFKKPPNILAEKISTWNLKKISLTVAAIFLIALTGFSVKLAGDYFYADRRATIALERLSAQNDTFILKQELDALTAQLKRFGGLISAQNINPQNFNALIKIGKIADGRIILSQIKTSDETFELEGVTESPDAVKSYLSRLKNSISPKVKLKSSAEIDGQFVFSISITP